MTELVKMYNKMKSNNFMIHLSSIYDNEMYQVVAIAESTSGFYAIVSNGRMLSLVTVVEYNDEFIIDRVISNINSIGTSLERFNLHTTDKIYKYITREGEEIELI